jgi:hypothetical protein
VPAVGKECPGQALGRFDRSAWRLTWYLWPTCQRLWLAPARV